MIDTLLRLTEELDVALEDLIAEPATTSATEVPTKKRIMSPAARKKIAAAQKARWANLRAVKEQ